MRHTITEGPNKGKRINIPDEFLQRSLRAYGMGTQEAVQMYLEDEGYLENEIVSELTAKAKSTGIDHDIKTTKTRKAPTRKPDIIKREFIDQMALVIEGDFKCQNVQITNPERMIAFEFGGENFELTLTKKRKPKE